MVHQCVSSRSSHLDQIILEPLLQHKTRPLLHATTFSRKRFGALCYLEAHWSLAIHFDINGTYNEDSSFGTSLSTIDVETDRVERVENKDVELDIVDNNERYEYDERMIFMAYAIQRGSHTFPKFRSNLELSNLDRVNSNLENRIELLERIDMLDNSKIGI